jgi:ABC-type transporter Mla MlaB component
VTAATQVCRHHLGVGVILKSRLSMEAHACGASAYVSGPLTASVAARAILACRALPPRVLALRVDLRGVSVCDADALTMLEVLLIEWRTERRGVTRIAYPPLRPRDAFVATPCGIRDAPDAELRPERDDRVVSTPPCPVW